MTEGYVARRFQAGCTARHFSRVGLGALRPQHHSVTHQSIDTEEIMKIRPLYDRVVVTRIAEEEKTKGGIIIPDTAKEKPVEGKVLAVGTGRVLEDGSVRKLDISVGDRVLFGKYSGTEVNINGEEHLILREDDILGVVEK
jgi:chaperonin GroES